jgi:2-polyprenyl-3-methyl-5-hydroxy-6-metoxy-1,4-benzoquinol methylase
VTVSHFDASARDWDSDPGKVERARAVADAMRAAIPLQRSMDALEYGCGTGLLSFALQADLGRITLADTSPGMLDVLREKIAVSQAANMHPLLLDLTSDPLPTERYDLTYSLMVLHHIEDTRHILGQFHALLKPSGILCVCDLDREDGSFHKHEFDGHHGFTREELKGLAQAAGFEQVRFSTAYEIVRDGRSYPLFLMTARKSQ